MIKIGLTTEIAGIAPTVPADGAKAFTAMVETVTFAYNQFSAWDDQSLRLKVIVAANFEDAVRSHANPPGSLDDYVAERLAGRAVAKNLPQNQDATEVVVVFSDTPWLATAGAAPGEQLLLVAHELAHPLVHRVYVASGLLDGVIYPSATPSEVSASSARVLWEEYCVDRLADVVLGAASTLTSPGALERPARAWDVWGLGHLASVVSTLDNARDNWPTIVNEHRNWRLTVGDMWYRILRSYDDATTVLVHAQASADGAGEDLMGAMASSQRGPDPLFSDTWPQFADVLRQHTRIPTVGELPEVDAAIREAGNRMFREVLRRLGLAAEDRPSRGSYVHVSEPLI